MNAFVTRIANYLANEILVKHLAQNKTFQNMALRTHLRVEKTKEVAKEMMEEVEKEGIKQAKTIGEAAAEGAKQQSAAGRPQPPARGFGGFVQAFVKEVKKDFGS